MGEASSVFKSQTVRMSKHEISIDSTPVTLPTPQKRIVDPAKPKIPFMKKEKKNIIHATLPIPDDLFILPENMTPNDLKQ